MSIYDSRYFILNKRFLRFMGLWPYDSWKRYVVRTFYLVLITVLTVPHLLGLILDVSNFDKFMEHFMIFLYLFAMILKMLTICIADEKIVIMLDTIVENYNLIIDFEEKQILLNFAERARLMTICYAVLVSASASFFDLLPLYAPILDAISPLPTPRNRTFILKGEYLVNNSTYYWAIYFSEALAVFLIVTVVLSVDTAYVACTQHCVGLFAIIKHRLQTPNQLVHDGQSGPDNGYQAMRNIIQLHQRVLEFTDILDNSYSVCFLALMILHVICLPASSTCILVNINEPVTLFRYALSFVCLAMHQFCLNWPAQTLTDASTDLFVDAYCSEWYRSSPKTKKLLMIFLLRCMRPSIISAGGLMDMGMENFYGIMRKAISYITVFASFR